MNPYHNYLPNYDGQETNQNYGNQNYTLQTASDYNNGLTTNNAPSPYPQQYDMSYHQSYDLNHFSNFYGQSQVGYNYVDPNMHQIYPTAPLQPPPPPQLPPPTHGFGPEQFTDYAAQQQQSYHTSSAQPHLIYNQYQPQQMVNPNMGYIPEFTMTYPQTAYSGIPFGPPEPMQPPPPPKKGIKYLSKLIFGSARTMRPPRICIIIRGLHNKLYTPYTSTITTCLCYICHY